MSPISDKAPPWVEVVMVGPIQAAEAWADYIYSMSGQGVIIEEVADHPEITRVKGYLGFTAELAAQRAGLEEFFAALKQQWPDQVMELGFSDLEPVDWSENWKRYFKPRRVTWHLIVTPPWEPVEPGPNQQVLIIDPGQAFGTGQHESTLLCLRRLERLRRHGRLGSSMLDVGCGTGILALAAVLMGVGRATAIDIDPLAVAATEHNAALNGLSDQVRALKQPVEQLSEEFSLVTANLTAKDLCHLAPALAPRLAPGGELVASGLLVEQVDQVRQAFEAQGLALLERDTMSGWAMLVLG